MWGNQAMKEAHDPERLHPVLMEAGDMHPPSLAM